MGLLGRIVKSIFGQSHGADDKSPQDRISILPPEERVKQLLTEHPDAFIAPSKGPSKFAKWCFKEDPEVVRLLIKKGGNVNEKVSESSHTESLLMSLASSGVYEIVKVLIEHGADVNYKSPKGETPLIAACQEWKDAKGVPIADRNERVKIVELLLKNGAIITNDCKGDYKSPMDWARLSEDEGILAVLEGHISGGTSGDVSSAGDTQYENTEWNFALMIPKNWEVVFENDSQDFPWTQPVRLAGPEGSRGRPYITVVTQLVEESGEGLEAYMATAERDLMGGFSNFHLMTKKERTLLGWPSAWMTYTYQGDSGSRKGLNVTTFFGKGKTMWFQFLCETDEEQAKQDFPVFERIVESLHIGSAGIRHPQVSLVGAPSCGLCGMTFPSGSKPNAMVNLNLGRLIGVCDSCRNA